MEKIVQINGQGVRFKASGALPLRYKAQFGRDLFADMAELENMFSAKIMAIGEVVAEIPDIDIRKMDMELFYNIVWTMARSADPAIPPLLDWLDGFDSFPVLSVFNELQDMLSKSIQPTKN